MPFERLFDEISGGSFYLGTYFGDCAYIKRWQHLWDQEIIFLGHVFVFLETKTPSNKRLRSVWPRCDALLRVEGRSDMH